jgi:hypothetical protein
MPEAEAAAAGQAVGSTRARHSTEGSTAAGFTAGITVGGAVTTAGTIKPPPRGRADKGLIIPVHFNLYLFPKHFDISGWNSTIKQIRFKMLGSQEALLPDLI